MRVCLLLPVLKTLRARSLAMPSIEYDDISLICPEPDVVRSSSTLSLHCFSEELYQVPVTENLTGRAQCSRICLPV